MRMRLAFGLVAAGALALSVTGEAEASSHREAPFLTRHPKVDNTDFYMFRSYEAGRQDFVTIVANYQPLQDPYGGPNYFSMDPDALYEIHIDNTGDAVEDLTFQFRFDNALKGGSGVALQIGPAGQQKTVAIPFVNANLGDPGPAAISAANQNDVRNVQETFTAKVVTGNRRTGTAADITHAAGPNAATPDPKVFVKPIDFVGTKTFGSRVAGADDNTAFTNYYNYARAHVYDNVTVPGCAVAGSRVFVGQRVDAFGVLLGNIFDLVNATTGQLLDANGGIPSRQDPGPNFLLEKNVTTIALEIPAACLQPNANEKVIGGWATASLRQARVLNPGATYDTPSREGGAWTQVSRLGMPLVNEVIIGIKDKDRFNASEPKDDGQFADYVTHPTLPAVLQALFGSASVAAPTVFPRADLVTAFLTGVPDVNKFFANPNAAGAEMLRLNVKDFGNPTAPANQQRLGAALCFASPQAGAAKVLTPGNGGCDPHGFPNGRRPGDDVVDIALRVAMGYLLAQADAPNTNLPLGDYVAQQKPDYPSAAAPEFPYLRDPVPGARN